MKSSEIESLVEDLSARLPMRRWSQPNLPNILPPLDVDLDALCIECHEPGPRRKDTKTSRDDMREHYDYIEREHRGKPKILGLNVLCISYLRRITPHRDHAWALFERIWDEKLDFMIERISHRFLISTLATYSECCEDPERRLLAKLGFQYGALVRLYETERKKEGRDMQHGSYQEFEKPVKLGDEGYRGIHFGLDNAVLNIHLYLAEEFHMDPVIGTLTATLIAHVRRSYSAFSRIDHERVRRSYRLDEQHQGWSFGKRPEGVEEPKLTDAEAG